MKNTRIVALFITGAGMILTTTAVAVDIDWNVAGPADYLDASNWNPNDVPDNPSEVGFVRNGGSAVLDGTALGAPDDLTLDGLFVGDENGQGTLAIRDLDSLTLSADLKIADNSADLSGSGNVTMQGEVILEHINTLAILGEIGIAEPGAEANVIATGNGTLTIRDVEEFNIGGDFDIGDGSANISSATVIQNPTVLVEDVTSMFVVGDLDICQNGNSIAATVETGIFNVTFRDIDDLEIESDFDLNRGAGSGFGADRSINSSTGTVTFDNVSVLLGTDIDDDERLSILEEDLEDESISQSSATVNLIDSKIVMSDDSEEVFNGIILGRLEGGSPNADTAISGEMNLTRSRTTSGRVGIGERFDNTAGSISAVISLSGASLIEAEKLVLGEDGTLQFMLDGATRVDSGTVGDADTYSAVNADMAELDGKILVRFDPGIEDGTTFDLIELNANENISGEFDVVFLGEPGLFEVVPSTITTGEILRVTKLSSNFFVIPTGQGGSVVIDL